MSIIDETKFVERFQFFDGQRLFASDLQGLEAFNREMRWLHNQSLHQPGVGSGFAAGGKKGDREVTIGPGYATDALGREIILTETETLPIPPVAGDKGNAIFFDLAIAYPDDSSLDEAENREGICTDRGVTRLREAPVFCWVELAGDPLTPRKPKLRADLQNGLKIRLARIAVLNCQLYSDISIAQRQNARPAVTPYIASGTETLGSLVLRTTPAATGNPQIITGTVDTRRAEFLTTPEYRAHLAGPREISLAIKSGNVKVVIFDQFQITVQKRDAFEFVDLQFVIPPVALTTKDVPILDGNGNPVISGGMAQTRTRLQEIQRRMQTEWQVIWMGIEG